MTCDISYDELAAYAAGDLDADRAAAIREHAAGCQECQGRIEALQLTDQLLAAAKPTPPPAEALLNTRRALAGATRQAPQSEIMTLEDVAEYLKISAEDLNDIVDDLPAFELAGNIRVRRTRLLDWIEQRERAYRSSAAASWSAHASIDAFNQGVA